jgi:hypothetical protein
LIVFLQSNIHINPCEYLPKVTTLWLLSALDINLLCVTRPTYSNRRVSQPSASSRDWKNNGTVERT